ncbi:hypothetical protein CBR_g24052 [Chara braunii]|uniref:C3H1-type domain-containing protein n=1 Tax=Chara braunii TaxID=69332 RepID=A0A388L5M9_CHABU|nr:hypothetical protein CBR_g24052 [Chara braunii]|eukprot:GBG77606.1 hypothetical protein CBR_g24052 [Chara braunii]
MESMGLLPVGSYYSAPPQPSYSMNTMSTMNAIATNKRPYDDGLGSVSMLAKKARPGGEGLGGPQPPYPQRPGEKECAYFMKHGNCSYGASCRFDHPLWVPSGGVPGWKENTSGTGGSDTPYPERPGEAECAFYMRNGECKFGITCKFHHPKERSGKARTNETPPPGSASTGKDKDSGKFNAIANGSSRNGVMGKDRGLYGKPAALSSKGLPIRPGETDCSFYMKTGSCKYGAVCKFNHPEVAPSGLEDFNVRSGITQSSTWPAGGAIMAASQHPQLISSTWGPQGPIAMPTQGMLGVELPMNPQGGLGLSYGGAPAVAASYPERPGQPECQFFLRNGECKFGASCKFHHPRKGAVQPVALPIAPPPGVKLTKAGLPRRPGETACAYYMKTATCKYGVQCKFDHPPPGEAVALATAAAKEGKDGNQDKNAEDGDKSRSGAAGAGSDEVENTDHDLKHEEDS